MNTYKTSEIAKLFNIHPNTVRLYEELEFIPKAKRQSNEYRIFTDFHIEQLRITRAALKVEILQNGLRKKAIQIIKESAKGNFNKAISLNHEYIKQLELEDTNAKEALTLVQDLLLNQQQVDDVLLKRKEVSEYLHITMDTLRNWELNGLLNIKRKANGYRVYTSEDICRLKIIRALRCANYSLSSILRMLNALSYNPDINIKEVIGKPDVNEDIITACDQLLISLKKAQANAQYMKETLEYMKKVYKTNPPF